ncbi:hypothetical protein BpHYR1_038664 [Brachionus plicatilis]|uniref:Uncharacterized protein n=1 Tax=Brachionus plicatilis TaxID=10195 RepID=A0A3M7RCW5_BRAPC|nr:hypothetical protein BpHYR1_038664 [Brachionus plicatilis]
MNKNNISNISRCQRGLLNEINNELNNEYGTDFSISQQTEFDWSPQININRVVYRVGRPKKNYKKSYDVLHFLHMYLDNHY